LGLVSISNRVSQTIACSRVSPHISSLGCKLPQNAGRSGLPKIMQRFCASSCTQRTPAGLPFGMPGIGLLMEGAVQHAPHCSLQIILLVNYNKKHLPCNPHGYWLAGQVFE
jgi:hypothetical protein